MDKVLHNQIKQRLHDSLKRHVLNYKKKKLQPLDLLIPKERKIRSIVGGMETSMGTTVWEPVAKLLAKNNSFEIIEEKILMPSPFPTEYARKLSKLISNRESKSTWISAKECLEKFRTMSKKIDKKDIEYINPPPGSGVDIYLRKNGVDYAFDTKTVLPNVGDIKKFNKQIMEWYAYSVFKNPSINIECKIAYPYNPYSSDFWSSGKHKNGILKPGVEALVENEFWNFLSGFENTYQHITSIFNELRSEGFGDELSDLITELHLKNI